MASNFIDFTSQHSDSNGNPLSSGVLEFYESGTSNPKEIYYDIAMTSSAGTSVSLGIDGRPISQLFLGQGRYSIIVKDSVGNVIDTLRDIEGQASLNTSLVTIQAVSYVTELRGVSPSNGMYAYCLSYDSDSESSLGGGYFRYETSNTTPDDGGFFLNYNNQSVGRWVRLLSTNEVNPYMMGCHIGTSARWVALSSTMQNHQEYNQQLVITKGVWNFDTDVVFNHARIVFEDGAIFNNTLGSPMTLYFNNSVITWNSKSKMFDGNTPPSFIIQNCTHNNEIHIDSMIHINYDDAISRYADLTANTVGTLPHLKIDKEVTTSFVGYQGMGFSILGINFYDGGSLKMNTGLTIGSVKSFATQNYGHFADTDIDLISISNNEYHWNYFANWNTSKYNSLINKGNVKVIVDANAVVDYSIPLQSTSTEPKLVWDIRSGNRIYASVDGVKLGRISSSSENCITQANGILPIVNQDIKLKWFDVNFDNVYPNQSYLQSAIIMSARSSAHYSNNTKYFVDGEGITIEISNGVSDILNLGHMYIKNLNIIDTRNSNEIVLAYNRGNMILDNVFIKGGFIASNDGTQSANIQLRNVRLSASTVDPESTKTMYLIGSKTILNNCQFEGIPYLLLGHFDLSKCVSLEINNSVLDSNVTAYSGSSRNVINSVLNNGLWTQINPSRTQMISNVIGKLELNGASANYTVSGLLVMDNMFDNNITTSNMATSGHRAKIVDNSLSNGNPCASTEVTFTYNFNCLTNQAPSSVSVASLGLGVLLPMFGQGTPVSGNGLILKAKASASNQIGRAYARPTLQDQLNPYGAWNIQVGIIPGTSGVDTDQCDYTGQFHLKFSAL